MATTTNKEILEAVQSVRAELKEFKESLSKTVLLKAEAYDRLMALLPSIRLSVGNVYAKTDDNGSTTVFVEYSKRVAKICQDEANGEFNYDDFIVAANRLNLITFEDMMRIERFVARYK